MQTADRGAAFARAAVLTCMLLLSTVAAGQTLLYDVTFDSPHAIGQQPALGTGPAPRNLVTQINFGDPRIAASVGPMTSQCLKLESPGSYEQVQFGLSSRRDGFATQYPYYRATLDFVVQSPTSSRFIVCFDSPMAHQIEFSGNPGNVIARTLGTGGYSATAGAFEWGKLNQLWVDTDLQSDRWYISMNGVRLFEGPFAASYMDTIRLHVSGSSSIAVGVDNIRIYGLPEPAGFCMLLAGAGYRLVRRPRRG